MRKTNEKKIRPLKALMIIFLGLVIFCVVTGIIGYRMSVMRRESYTPEYVYSDEIITITDSAHQGIGTVQVSTLKLPNGIYPGGATYTPSGRVLVDYHSGGEHIAATMNDDGSGWLEVYRGRISGGFRMMVFADNSRILLGDAVLECPAGQSLDDCEEDSMRMVPVRYPPEMVEDRNVTQRWSEIIVAPDNEHIAWTMLRSDCGAASAIGRLVRYADEYIVEDAQYISSSGYKLNDDGFLEAIPVRGGEVKQFVHGGTAISLVGAAPNGMADSVVQDIATGDVTRITLNPGYDETTIFSPNMVYGLVMTSRFSPSTDMAVLGLLPRPHGEAVMSMMTQIYMYCVTGVRSVRDGNIGPALINIERSMNDPQYTGLDLHTDNDWVYVSPMSWNNESRKGMWIERQRNGGGVRIRIVELLDAADMPAVDAQITPRAGSYSDDGLGQKAISGTIPGMASGCMEISKRTGTLTKTRVTVKYENYSNDGETFFNGTETVSGGLIWTTRYISKIMVTDKDGNLIGSQEICLIFGPAISLSTFTDGGMTPRLDADRSKGTAGWYDLTADTDSLIE